MADETSSRLVVETNSFRSPQSDSQAVDICVTVDENNLKENVTITSKSMLKDSSIDDDRSFTYFGQLSPQTKSDSFGLMSLSSGKKNNDTELLVRYTSSGPQGDVSIYISKAQINSTNECSTSADSFDQRSFIDLALSSPATLLYYAMNLPATFELSEQTAPMLALVPGWP